MFNHHGSPHVHDIMRKVNEQELARREVRRSLLKAAKDFQPVSVESRARTRRGWLRLPGLGLSHR